MESLYLPEGSKWIRSAVHLKHGQAWRGGRSASLLQQDHDVIVDLHQAAQLGTCRIVVQVAPSQKCRHRVLLRWKRVLSCMDRIPTEEAALQVSIICVSWLQADWRHLGIGNI